MLGSVLLSPDVTYQFEDRPLQQQLQVYKTWFLQVYISAIAAA
jgi:hypothetical protein